MLAADVYPRWTWTPPPQLFTVNGVRSTVSRLGLLCFCLQVQVYLPLDFHSSRFTFITLHL